MLCLGNLEVLPVEDATEAEAKGTFSKQTHSY